MAIYRFKCQCGNIIEEIFNSSNIAKEINCVNCGGKAKYIPSAPAVKIMSEKRKEHLRKLTGREINSHQEEEKYLKDNNLLSVSKREWQEIKAKRDARWNNYYFDKGKIKENMVEGVRRIVENVDERRKINLYNLEKKKEAEKIINKKIDAVEI